MPGESVQELLVRQVQSGVYMEDIIRGMIADGADQFIEIGPGKTLSGFVRRTDRRVKTISISTVEDIKNLDLSGQIEQGARA